MTTTPNTCETCGLPTASVDDVVARRAPYSDSPGGHADRHTLVLEAADRVVREAPR